MDIRDLKEEILNRELISDILTEIGCHHIRDKGDYIQAGNKDGDNPNSIVVYKNEYISCLNYTRQITKNGSGYIYQSKKPGNVPGSYAIYYKEVDVSGNDVFIVTNTAGISTLTISKRSVDIFVNTNLNTTSSNYFEIEQLNFL